MLCALLLTGCGYLAHVAAGQAKLLAKRQPVEKVLQDPYLSEQDRQKIRLIVEVKTFATEYLGLQESNSYSTYVHVDGPYVSYNLSAASKDTLEAYTWRFPIVGRLPYKGFFRKDNALREELKLADQGYDTYVRGVRAFSTLGYFDDPIVSCMLTYTDSDLIETIIHELLHLTVWVKGSVSFNESLANFVGEKGTLEFLALSHGDSSLEYRHYQDILTDTRLFEKYMQSIISNLEELYGLPIDREEKIHRRGKLFERARTDYASIISQMKTGLYENFFEWRTLNNAVLLSFRRYHHDTDFFEEALTKHEGNLRQMIASFKTLRADQIPVTFRMENNHR